MIYLLCVCLLQNIQKNCDVKAISYIFDATDNLVAKCSVKWKITLTLKPTANRSQPNQKSTDLSSSSVAIKSEAVCTSETSSTASNSSLASSASTTPTHGSPMNSARSTQVFTGPTHQDIVAALAPNSSYNRSY